MEWKIIFDEALCRIFKQQKQVEDVTVKKPLLGSMKGNFLLPLAEDFDDPLEEIEVF
jgi:hypothetical protein